jgi:deazaflavin-dependent oxidoreductase (nitroreductase family)
VVLDLRAPGWRRSLTLAVIRAHALVLRLARGRLLGRLAGMEVVLLETRGRRSGRRRVTPLTTIPDGDRLLLVGSAGGSDRSPAWALNLEADGRCVLTRRGQTSTWLAIRVDAAERDRLWALVVARHPGYGRYQSRTRREIPVFALERR